jgi:hypothetical protein
MLIIGLSSCKKDFKSSPIAEKSVVSGSRTYSFVKDSFLIPIFIDSVNAVFARQSSNQEISIDSAIDLMEASLNYSLSDIDSALKNHDTTIFNADFTITPNANGKFNFINVANVAKSLADSIRSICTATNLRLSVCKIEKINESLGQYRLYTDIGEIDENFDFEALVEPPTITGDFLWRVDEYEVYPNVVNCQYLQPYAPRVLYDKINEYLRNVTTQRLKDVALAAPFGHIVYYDNVEVVFVGSTSEFTHEDFVNLSKRDWPIGILSSSTNVCSPAVSGEPVKSSIYAADPEKVACLIDFSPSVRGHKSCINSTGINYYIKKSLDIWDAIRPTTRSNMFHEVLVTYVQPENAGELLIHKYRFRTQRARTRPAGASVL